MFDRIYPAHWMSLPKEDRDFLAHAFSIPRSGVTEILDQTVVSDGYTVENLGTITAERMAEFVGSEADFPRLWELTLAKVRSELNPPMGVIMSGVVAEDTPAAEDIELLEVIAEEPNGDLTFTTNRKPHVSKKKAGK